MLPSASAAVAASLLHRILCVWTLHGVAMRVREVMTRHPAVVTRADPIGQAAATMAEFEVGILPVVKDRETLRLEGVLTDRDITIRHVAWNHDGGCTVADHMTSRKLVTVREDDDVRDVIGRMRETGFRRLPVVDASQRVVGIVSQADLEVELGAPGAGSDPPRA